MNAISLNNLTKTYRSKGTDVAALKGVSFDIKQGEFFGLLGPNGAGKSTLISILAGVTEKSGGTATVNGIDIDKDPTGVKMSIGIVPQEISYDMFFTIDTALKFQFGYYGQKIDKKYLDELLKRLSLDDKRKEWPNMLSGGMKRRLMIARALIHRPKILILDEPTAGVDVELRHGLHDFVRELNRQGTTVILTSHYLEEVELLCERVGIMHKGNLVALDNKKELKNRFQTTRIFSIALAEPLKTMPESLKKFDPKMEDGELRLTFEENRYAEILQTVSKANLPLSNFRVIEPSLEDVFVSLTNGK
jgi:ABC-2 type transport system ATP-binding protein